MRLAIKEADVLCVAPLATALAGYLVIVASPELFQAVFVLNLWLLGYQHVMATYSKLCFDRESFRRNQLLVVWLPPIILAAVYFLSAAGLAVLATIYFYWQWFHYTRQSWGIYRWLARGEKQAAPDLILVIIYGLPILGVLFRSWQAPDTFVSLPFYVLPVSTLALLIAGGVFAATLVWTIIRALMSATPVLPKSYPMAFLGSHLFVFSMAYFLIEDITLGWLFVNIWHNFQYVVFVWMSHRRKYAGGVEAGARFLSTLAQPKRWPIYVAVMIALSAAFYLAVQNALSLIIPSLVAYFAINFHHYVVDAVIWRAPKRKKTPLAS